MPISYRKSCGISTIYVHLKKVLFYDTRWLELLVLANKIRHEKDTNKNMQYNILISLYDLQFTVCETANCRETSTDLEGPRYFAAFFVFKL